MTMNSIFQTLTRAFVALLFMTIIWVSTADAAAPKLGAVNLQIVLDKSDAGKKALESLKSRAVHERKVLEQKRDAIINLEKELDSQKMMMRPETISEKERALKKLKREFKLYREDTESMFKQEQGRVMRKVINDIMRVIKKYGKDNGYTLIMEKGDGANMGGPVVLYIDSSIDLTADVIKILNKEEKAE